MDCGYVCSHISKEDSSVMLTGIMCDSQHPDVEIVCSSTDLQALMYRGLEMYGFETAEALPNRTRVSFTVYLNRISLQRGVIVLL